MTSNRGRWEMSKGTASTVSIEVCNASLLLQRLNIRIGPLRISIKLGLKEDTVVLCSSLSMLALSTDITCSRWTWAKTIVVRDVSWKVAVCPVT
eukprot:6236738-Amphidinium_carterae.2